MYELYFFFFSSRRRHTRFDCDWSSDVCSSDLWHDGSAEGRHGESRQHPGERRPLQLLDGIPRRRSEEHTSELQSQSNLVCRLLLEKKKRYAAVVSMRIATLMLVYCGD